METLNNQPQPSLEEGLKALDAVPEGAQVGDEDWKDAIQLVVALRKDPQSQEKLAAKVAEKFGVSTEKVLQAAKEASIHPKERLMARIKELPKDISDEEIHTICKEIAVYGILDEVAQKRLTRALAEKVKHIGLTARDLSKLVKKYQDQYIEEAAREAGITDENSQESSPEEDGENIITINEGQVIKEVITNAPIPDGLKLPKKYVMKGNGKIYRIEDSYLATAAPVPIFVRRDLVDIDRHPKDDERRLREVVFLDKDGRWTSAIAPARTIGDSRKILKLITDGLELADWAATDLARYLNELVLANRGVIPTTYRVSSMGWRQWQDKTVFVWGPYVLGVKKEEAPEVTVDSPGEQQLLDALQPGGTWEGWLNEVMQPAMQYPSFRMGIYAALASPLLAHCAVQGFVFHYARRSTRGKTTAAQVAISTAGYPGGPGVPDKPGLCRPWNATRVGPERVFSFLRHIPAYLDDSQEVRSNEDLADIIYMLANGSGRVRGAVRGMQRTATWRLVLLSTGENTLADASKMAGVLVRAIDWTIEPFEGAKPGTDLAAEALRFKVAASKHYGQALPRFVLSLIKYGVERLAQEHLETTRRITEKVRQRLDNPNELVDRLAGAFGVIALAGALFHELTVPKDHPLAQVTREEVEEFVAHWFSRLMADVQPVHTHVRAYHEFLAWAMRNKESFYNPKNPDRPQPTQGWLGNYPYRVRGIIGDCVTVPPDLLRSLLEKWGYPYDAVLREWKQEGWLVPGDGQYTRPVRCGKNAPLTRHVVVRILGLEEGEGEGAAAQESFEQEADDPF